jgi:hypothetical protein
MLQNFFLIKFFKIEGVLGRNLLICSIWIKSKGVFLNHSCNFKKRCQLKTYNNYSPQRSPQINSFAFNGAGRVR